MSCTRGDGTARLFRRGGRHYKDGRSTQRLNTNKHDVKHTINTEQRYVQTMYNGRGARACEAVITNLKSWVAGRQKDSLFRACESVSLSSEVFLQLTAGFREEPSARKSGKNVGPA